MRLLIVEDDAALGPGLRSQLAGRGYAVDLATNGIDGAHLGATEPYDAVILDLGLPGKPGLAVLKDWRAAGNRVPVLVLTARDGWAERVEGLQAGADDYIVKPFSVPELLARVRGLLRRARPERMAARLSYGDITIDRETHRVVRGERSIDLGPTEYRLLEFLMENPGRVYSREQLLNGVWGRDIYIDERTVDVHIGRLRKQLNQPGMPDPIRTVRGAGYGLDDSLVSAARD